LANGNLIDCEKNDTAILNGNLNETTLGNDNLNLSADQVISTGRRMTNLVSNFECLFWFFFQWTLKLYLKEVQFTQNHLFWVKAPLWLYLEGAPNLKTRRQFENLTITIIQKGISNLKYLKPPDEGILQFLSYSSLHKSKVDHFFIKINFAFVQGWVSRWNKGWKGGKT